MKKVLIVDDDLVIARIYQGLLRMEGAEVEVATDGEVALRVLQSFQPDLVLLDLMLPKVNGIEVLKQIRAAPATRALPVIVFSNAYLSDMIAQAMAAGATKCLVKAQTVPKQVLEVIRTILASSEHRQVDATSRTGSPAAPPSPHQPSASGSHLSSSGQDDIRQTLLASTPRLVATLRGSLHNLFKSAVESEQNAHLVELCRALHALTSSAGMAGFSRMAKLCSAVEAFIEELRETSATPGASSVRTIAKAVDRIESLLPEATEGKSESLGAPRIMVVDDEPISRQVIESALQRASLNALALDSPSVALAVLSLNVFDLIFLDVQMPGMSGFQLCKELRRVGPNRSTPVVFVTALTDFESRAQSILSGGDDIMAKPFLPLELTVKALTHVLKQDQEQEILPACDRFSTYGTAGPRHTLPPKVVR